MLSKTKVLTGTRQKEVLALIAKGKCTYVEIAQELNITNEMVIIVTLRLARKGLIERYPTGHGQACRLTELGQELASPKRLGVGIMHDLRVKLSPELCAFIGADGTLILSNNVGNTPEERHANYKEIVRLPGETAVVLLQHLIWKFGNGESITTDNDPISECPFCNERYVGTYMDHVLQKANH